MIINRNNYESYLVDFAEGVLSKELVPEMERFLLLNPDIKEEFDLFNDGLMDEFSIEFPEKNRLKQIPLKIADASSKEFQHFCVAYVEGWMTEQEKSVFEKAIQKDLVKEQELKLFQQSILPDVLIGFDEKVLLKPNEQNPKITQENFESYCIGCVEGWLNQKQMIALNNYVMLETKRRSTLEFYKKLKLVPDYSIFYPDKNKIKRFVLLNVSIRKYVSYAASAAAILVFALMIYYSSNNSQVNQLATSTVNVKNSNALVSPNTQANAPDANTNRKAVLFGFDDIKKAGKEAAIIEQNTKSYTLEPMAPIQAVKLECAPCIDVFDGLQNIQNPQKSLNQHYISDEATEEEIMEQLAAKSLLNNLTDASLTGLNKITNGKLVIKKSTDNQKMRIALNTRYFAFSTQVKNDKNKTH